MQPYKELQEVFMLYPNSQTNHLSHDLFKNPTCEYRSTPFWAWNGKLDSKRLSEQIQIFRQMGFGGFHMHVRTGMSSPYLDKEFMEHITHCIEEAKAQHMLAWLYDEDRWPSGTAGGRVTKEHPEYSRKSLLFTTVPYPEHGRPRFTQPEPGCGQENIRQENGILLGVYDIYLYGNGTLKKAIPVKSSQAEAPGAVRWYAYMEHCSMDPWFNNHAYVDTMNPDAISDFIEKTHEVYARHVGNYFGNTVPAIFTDEPQITPKEPLNFALEQKDIFLPWTEALPGLYEKTYGENLMEHLPELIFELPYGRLSPVRWRFQNLLTDLFVENYCQKIGNWCKDHGLSLTGHVMGEGSLFDQTQAVGDAMRCYRFFDIPGIDMLCDFHEYTSAKQAQSIVRQTGKTAMLSELYGVTGWDYDFRGYKLQGDWQAALGVTVRVPHLAWMTMKGEAKRDYPASISYQSPWWTEYSMVEDHFARLNTALTRGKPVVQVAVLHPIESYWLYWGPNDHTGALRKEMDEAFLRLTETLLFGGIDFDFLCEAELPSLCKEKGFPLKVGAMSYDTVIIPRICTIRSTTLKLLTAFGEAGGKVIFLGDCPSLVDAQPSHAAKPLYASSIQEKTEGFALLSLLEDDRILDIHREDGLREDRLLHQIRREENGDLWLFVCNGKNPQCPDVDPSPLLNFKIKGEYKATWYDTLTGNILEFPTFYKEGNTLFTRRWYMHDSMLLLLHPEKTPKEAVPELPASPLPAGDFIMGQVPVTLQDPNMLLLDMAEYSINGGPFFSEDELLRIDNHVRLQLGIPLRRKEVVQPYLLEPETPTNFLTLRFRLSSELPLKGLCLALEDADTAKIRVNHQPLEAAVLGYYVDKDIHTISLPDFNIGENILEVQVPVGKRTNLEYFYLLGNFGVKMNGTQKILTSPVTHLGFGDIVPQNLPFFTGILTYHTKIRAEGTFTVRIPQYRGGVVKVLLDGKDVGNIAFSPYTLTVPCDSGEHELDFKLFTTRYNGFGQLHHTQGVYYYQSPNSWRSAGDLWSYEYRLKPSGILKSPELLNAVFLDSSGQSRISSMKAVHVTDRS